MGHNYAPNGAVISVMTGKQENAAGDVNVFFYLLGRVFALCMCAY